MELEIAVNVLLFFKGPLNMLDTYSKSAHPVCICSPYLMCSVIQRTVENTGREQSPVEGSQASMVEEH